MKELDFLGGKIELRNVKAPQQPRPPFDATAFYRASDELTVDECCSRIRLLISNDPYRVEYYFYAIDRDLPGIENIGIIARHYSINVDGRINRCLLMRLLNDISEYVSDKEKPKEDTMLTESAIDQLMARYRVQSFPVNKKEFIHIPEHEVVYLAKRYKSEGERFGLESNIAFSFAFDLGKLMRTFGNVVYKSAAEAVSAAGKYNEIKAIADSADSGDRDSLIRARDEIKAREDCLDETKAFFVGQLDEAIKRAENHKLNLIFERAKDKKLIDVLKAADEINALDYKPDLKAVYIEWLNELKLKRSIDTYLYTLSVFTADECISVYNELLWLRAKSGAYNGTVTSYIENALSRIGRRYYELTGSGSIPSSEDMNSAGRVDCEGLCREYNAKSEAELAVDASTPIVDVPDGILNPGAYRVFARASAKTAYAVYNYARLEEKCRNADSLSLTELKELRALINNEGEYADLARNYMGTIASIISDRTESELKEALKRGTGLDLLELESFRQEMKSKLQDIFPERRGMYEAELARITADVERADMEQRCFGFDEMSREKLAELKSYAASTISTDSVRNDYMEKLNRRIYELEDNELKVYISGIDSMDTRGKTMLMDGLSAEPYSSMSDAVLIKYRNIILNKVIGDKVRKYYDVCAGVGQSGLYGIVTTGFDGTGAINQSLDAECRRSIQFELYELPLAAYLQHGIFGGANGIVITDKNVYVNAKGQVTKVPISDHPVINVTYKTFNAELWLCVGKNYMQLPCKPPKQQGEPIRNVLNNCIATVNRINMQI